MQAQHRANLWLLALFACFIATCLLLVSIGRQLQPKAGLHHYRDIDLAFERTSSGFRCMSEDEYYKIDFAHNDDRVFDFVNANDVRHVGTLELPFQLYEPEGRQLNLRYLPFDKDSNDRPLTKEDGAALIAALKAYMAADTSGDFATLWGTVNPVYVDDTCISLIPYGISILPLGVLASLPFWVAPFLILYSYRKNCYWCDIAREQSKTMCSKCGYSLAGLSQERYPACPECGRTRPASFQS